MTERKKKAKARKVRSAAREKAIAAAQTAARGIALGVLLAARLAVDALRRKPLDPETEERLKQEAAMDAALKDTFPASDPPAATTPTTVTSAPPIP